MKKKLLAGLIACLAVTLSLVALVTFAACSKVKELTTLDDPVIVGYDPDSGKISWKFVDNAASYEVTLSDGTDNRTTEVKTSNISYTTSADSFDFSITAKGDGLYSDSNTVSVTFVKLGSDITLTTADDGTVSWDPVSGATGYQVAVDNSVADTVVDTSYSGIAAGSVHSVKVKPVRSNTETTMYYSTWCQAVSVNKLQQVAISAIKYSDGNITWTNVASASSYKLTINNTEYEVAENKYAYSAGGESFAVTVQAIGNHTSTYDATVSDQKSFVYLSAVASVRVENGVLTWDEIEGATGYQVKLNGTNSTAASVKTNSYEGLSAGRQYFVCVLPTATAENAEYFSDWSAVASVYILNAPVLAWTGVNVDGTDAQRAINWNAVEGAGGYTVKVTSPEGRSTESSLGAAENFYADNFSSIGTYKIEVKATSSTSDSYESAYSTPMNVTRLAAPTVSAQNIVSTATSLANGFTVTFNAVSGATSYLLYKDGNQVLSSNTTQFNVTDIVNSDNTRQASVAFYVQSVGSMSGNNITLASLGSEAQASLSSAFTVTVLPTPTDPTIEDTEYSFTGVTGGSGYNVKVSDNNFTAQGTSLNLDNILQTGSYSVSACTMGNGHEVLASTYSTAIEVDRLIAPYDLKIATDDSDGVLSFSGDNRASSYTAIFSGRDEPLTVDTTTNVREYIETTGTVLYMRSVANRFYDDQRTVYYMTSLASSNYTFYKLEAPGNIHFTNEQMIWNAPTNLGNSTYTPVYKIYNGSNNSVYNGNFSGTSYSLATLEGGNTYSFGIVAIGDGVTTINSESASSSSVTKLVTPTLRVNTDEFQYEWTSVASASNYVLQIDGATVSNEIHSSGNTYTYKPTYSDIGSHTVILYAVGDEGNTTINSSLYTYTQQVQQLSTPAFNYSYGADCYDPSANMTVNITTETNCPNGYYYVIGTTSHYEEETSYSFNPNTSGAIEISVYAMGGSFDAQEIYYLDSRRATTVTLTLLGYPVASSIDVNEDGQITWGKIDGASGYIYTLSIVDTDGKNYTYFGTIDANTATLDLSSGFTAVDGDGNNVSLTYQKIRTMRLELQAKGTLSANQTTTYNGSVSSQTVIKEWASALH